MGLTLSSNVFASSPPWAMRSARSLRSVAPRAIRQPGPYQHALGAHVAPIARVRPGETVEVETVDCFGDRLTAEDQIPSETIGPHLNPVTGPLYVEGAEPGDTLAVEIGEIEATRDWAISCVLPDCGALAPDRPLAGSHPPAEERVWLYRRANRGFAWGNRWEIPWAPFFGTIGVAPAVGATSTETAGAHGGNIDVPDLRPGTTLYLPVFHPGALFFVGDAHAAQGQGELGGPALEISAQGTFTFQVLKGRTIGSPRIESADALMAIGSARPMDDAARRASRELVTWLTEDHGFDPLDACQLLTQAGGLHVANMVNPDPTVVASCPKRYLDTATPSPTPSRYGTPLVPPVGPAYRKGTVS